MNEKKRSTLKIVFLTLFLDLVGFSIIFPLFPELMSYYLKVDHENFFLRFFTQTLTEWTNLGSAEISHVVLFGGLLGALYSLLQFLCAPFWGALSDRIGRRPVLIISLTGLSVSYLMWFFSGSFTLLIAARFLGGVMGGNISTATAVVGDITSSQNRSRGMAVVGIAFALGFIFGPALGGLLAHVDLTSSFPHWSAYGVNPFSMPAALAFVLSVLNLLQIIVRFSETLPPSQRRDREHSQVGRSMNPLYLFTPLPYKGINSLNLAHFLFLAAFSGMEFTLTFLAFERLGYLHMDNALLFVFIGVLVALVQGGHVRRKASQVGEKKMAIQGLGIVIPGLLGIALAQSSLTLYLSLFFLSVGSAMAIPCLTALVSLYAPPHAQGQVLGIYRSLGALARVVGPLAASLLYWHLGSPYPYVLGALFLLLPISILFKLPKRKV